MLPPSPWSGDGIGSFKNESGVTEEGGGRSPSDDRSELHASVRADAERHTSLVTSSSSERRIVAAGPGTGKTHLFKAVLEGKSKALVLTFINALLEDLHVQLPASAEVRDSAWLC